MKEKKYVQTNFFPMYLPNQKMQGRDTANKQFFKDGLVGVTVELYKHQIECGETCFVHIYLLQKGIQTVAISFECLPVFHKKKRHTNDIATVRVFFCNKYM